MECSMLSAKDIAAVKTAIEICNDQDLKREILCASGSEYDINKEHCELGSESDIYNLRKNVFARKYLWNEIIQKKAAILIKRLCLPENLQEKIIGLVLPIGMRMLTWAEYHESVIGLSREYSINFFNSSIFTQQGILDKKAAQKLMSDKSLSIEKKYKLACLYCFSDYIPALYIQTMKPQCIKQHGIVKFWSDYLVGEVDKLKGEKTLDKYILERAIMSGSKAAVEYCLENTNIRMENDVIVKAAVAAVKNKIILERDYNDIFRDRNVVFWLSCTGTWVPSDYYVDILCLLLSKMGEDQLIKFLRYVERIKIRFIFKGHGPSKLLEFFLNWPYQVSFMEKARMMWEFLPEPNYAALLLKICDKMEPGEDKNLFEENSYDYRGLFKEFWLESPERYKRYVLTNQELVHRTETLYTSTELLIKILTLKNFIYEDRENIKIIMASASDKEKENIISSKEVRDFCIELIKEEKWHILNRFVLSCFSAREEADKVKRELFFTEEAQRVCIDFVKNGKWNAAELSMKWSALPEEEITQLKKEMIHSEDGMQACLDLIPLNGRWAEDVDRFIWWHSSSDGEVKAFKKRLIFSERGVHKCADLVKEDKLDLANRFIKLCLSSEIEVGELKKNVAYRTGNLVFEESISNYLEEDSLLGHTIKWEKVDKFLTWCFSSEKEIGSFKRNVLLEKSGVKVHFNFIKSHQFKEAETLFSWLGLSTEEVKELKKETLFNYESAKQMFSEFMYDEFNYPRFAVCGSSEEAIELLLSWYLTDKETVFEFKRKREEYVNEGDTSVLEDFDWMIERRLMDIEEEQE